MVMQSAPLRFQELRTVEQSCLTRVAGKEFYGPDGVYPFAGRECARAFALVSTDVADCSDDLEGLGAMEMESLRDWEARFWNKYRMIGRVVS